MGKIPGVGHIPFIGKKISSTTKYLDEKAQKAAEDLSVPWIAVSDAHRIEDLGVAYIEWNGMPRTTSQDDFFEDIGKKILSKGHFSPYCGYEGSVDWILWNTSFIRGIGRSGQDKEVYIQSDKLH